MQFPKDKILIISPTVPRPDMNSGDLRLYSILDILAKKYEISFVPTQNMPGDDAYIALLEQHNITVYMEQFSLKKLLKSKKFKVAILEFYFTAEYYLDRIRILQPECLVIVDSVDVHYLRFKLKYDLTKDEIDHGIYLETKGRELRVYRKADAVITVTSDDASALITECPDIKCEVVPNVHELCLNDASPESNTLIFVGGFSHAPNVDAVLYFCSYILPLIKNEKQELKFMIVGSNPPNEIRILESESIKVTGYVPETTPYLHQSQVSVAPLRYGAGMKGKIGEAMAHGIPVVTTPVGAQGMGLADRENAMIADSPRGFADAVLALLNDKCLHAKIRNNAIQIMDDNFTSKQVAQTMVTVLKRICGKPAKKIKLNEKVAFLCGYISQWIRTRLSSC